MKASKVKWLLGFLVFGGLLAVGGFTYYNKSKKIEYTLVRLQRGDIESVISATGSCNAKVSVQVGAQVSGNILELHADYNTKVKKGQLVARIDPAPFQARVDQANANLESARASVVNAQASQKKAEADVANAQANIANQKANIVRAQSAVADAKSKLERRVQMFKEGVISREERDSAQATYDQSMASLEASQAQLGAAQSSLESVKAQQDVVKTQLITSQSQVKQQQANLEQAQLDLEHTMIRAPVDGTVIARNMDVGQTVAASFSAPTIFQIAQDLTKMQVDTNIDESDISRAQLSQTATFTVDAYPGQVFMGEIAQIRRAPINVQNVITYDVVVDVDNQELKLFPGMTANVRILTEKVTGVLRLPSAALRFRPPDAAKDAGQNKNNKKGGGGQGGQGRGGGGQGRGGGQGKGGFGGGGGGFGGGGLAAAAGRGPGGGQFQTVYVLDEKGQPKAERLRTGISDGNFMAVVGGNLQEGQEVITGIVSSARATAAAPGFPGGNQNQFKGRGGFGF